MKLPAGLTRTVGRNILKFKKNSPHIFFTAGVIGGITSTILACRATLKLSDTLDEIQTDIHNVKKLESTINVKHTAITYPSGEPEVNLKFVDSVYRQGDYNRDMIYVHAQGGWKLIKLYGPSVILGVASIASLTGSHVQMTRRNTALMAAYAAVQQAFEEYRQRVSEQIGADEELDFYLGLTDGTITSEEGTQEDTKILSRASTSPYARLFDEYSSQWVKDPELNMMFLRCQQNHANMKLQSRGHVFLNEVYEWLGLDHTPAGSVVGWIRRQGDDWVDFGIYEARNEGFVKGWERSVLLDFNVDGVIYDKI